MTKKVVISGTGALKVRSETYRDVGCSQTLGTQYALGRDGLKIVKNVKTVIANHRVVMLYGVLGIDGRWRDLKVLKAEPAEAGQAALVTLPHSVLSPPACGIRNVKQPAAIIVTFAWYGGILPPKQ